VVWFRTLGPDQLSETVAGIAFIVGVVVFGGSLVTLSLTASADGARSRRSVACAS
jgi:uncharacterized membrane protein YgdD (TMEM256/DUF423 family)